MTGSSSHATAVRFCRCAGSVTTLPRRSDLDPVASEDLERLRVAAHVDDVVGLEDDPEPVLEFCHKRHVTNRIPVRILADLERFDVGAGRQVERIDEVSLSA